MCDKGSGLRSRAGDNALAYLPHFMVDPARRHGEAAPMPIPPENLESQMLEYAAPAARLHPLRSRAAATATILVGCLALITNLLIAGAMFRQLSKQMQGFKGVSPLPIEPWLITTGIETTLSALMGMCAVIVGAITLRNPGRGPKLHRVYALLKLPLACVFGVCVGWGMRFYVSSEPQIMAAGGILAAIASAAHPIVLLRMFPRSHD